jgi:hypothetical protein
MPKVARALVVLTLAAGFALLLPGGAEAQCSCSGQCQFVGGACPLECRFCAFCCGICYQITCENCHDVPCLGEASSAEASKGTSPLCTDPVGPMPSPDSMGVLRVEMLPART